MEDNSTKTEKKKIGVRGYVIAFIGAIIIALGIANVFPGETANNIAVEAGASAVASGVMKEQYDAYPVVIKIADVLDAAADARTTDTKQLGKLINQAAGVYVPGAEFSHFVAAVISQLNEAYKVSATEEQYIEKIRCISRGLRHGAETTEPRATIEETEAAILKACEEE